MLSRHNSNLQSSQMAHFLFLYLSVDLFEFLLELWTLHAFLSSSLFEIRVVWITLTNTWKTSLKHTKKPINYVKRKQNEINDFLTKSQKNTERHKPRSLPQTKEVDIPPLTFVVPKCWFRIFGINRYYNSELIFWWLFDSN